MSYTSILKNMHKRNQGLILKYAYQGKIDNFLVPFRNTLYRLHNTNQRTINKINKKEQKKKQKKTQDKSVNGKNSNSNRGKRYIIAKQIRTPSWAKTHKQRLLISKMYREARIKTITTGKQYSVDHIIPLRGHKVSGLHVYENLKIMPTLDNCGKSNNFKC